MRVINSNVRENILINGYRRFCHSWWTIIMVILLFPFVFYYSRKYQKLFLPFCFSYERTGMITTDTGQVIAINSLAYYHYDCYSKGLSAFGYPLVFANNKVKEVMIKNRHQQNISCLIITQQKNSTKWVLGFHGWTENKYLALRLVSYFYEQGYNVITFDSVAHGQSYGQYSDIGFTCSNDINDIINWLTNNYQVVTLGLIGNSMGAATINYYLAHHLVPPVVKWAISDCGFSNLLVQFRFVMQYRYCKPWWLISNNLAHRYQNFTQTNIKKYDVMTKNKLKITTPLLLIHGKSDDFVPFFMSKRLAISLQQPKKNNCETLFLDNINHVASLTQAHHQYITRIKQFINKYEANSEE